MLTVLGGLAEFERELIRARTGEGRKRLRHVGQLIYLDGLQAQQPVGPLDYANWHTG
jgi:DNA invertase Pin-like site-specific DNA recombinase